MLKWRLIAAFTILIPLIGLLCFDYLSDSRSPGVWLTPIGLLIVAGATGECLRMLGDRECRPHRLAVWPGSIGVYAAACIPIWWSQFGEYPVDCPIGKFGWIVLAVTASVIGAFLVEMYHYQSPGQSLIRVSLAIGIIGYCSLLTCFLVLLRSWHSNGVGMVALVSMILVTKISDTGAYFTGRRFGRRKLIPRISPGKTIEGSLGGFAASVAASYLFFAFVAPRMATELNYPIAWWRWLIYGIAVCAAGMLGDLAESLIKRDLGHKDSSTWLPGLGGILDIVDSLLFAAPVAYFCWLVGILC